MPSGARPRTGGGSTSATCASSAAGKPGDHSSRDMDMCARVQAQGRRARARDAARPWSAWHNRPDREAMTTPSSINDQGFDVLAADGGILRIRPVVPADRDALLDLYGRTSD